MKKPGLMRWIYTNPEPQEFVSDGLKMYSYIPEDRQVVVSNVPRRTVRRRHQCSSLRGKGISSGTLRRLRAEPGGGVYRSEIDATS